MPENNLANAWKAFKGWVGGLFKALDFMAKREHLIKKAPQSVKTNIFFAYFIIVAIVMWLLALLMLHRSDPTQISIGWIANRLTVAFIIFILAIAYCNIYHNKRPNS